MTDKVPNLITSGLSEHVTKDGILLEVCIYRLEDQTTWTLEVVTPDKTSIVWNDEFETDDLAFTEFEKTVTEVGVAGMLNEGNVIEFPKRN